VRHGSTCIDALAVRCTSAGRKDIASQPSATSPAVLAVNVEARAKLEN